MYGLDRLKERSMFVTSARTKGVVDIHESRSLTIFPDSVREWLHAGTYPERAEKIAYGHCFAGKGEEIVNARQGNLTDTAACASLHLEAYRSCFWQKKSFSVLEEAQSRSQRMHHQLMCPDGTLCDYRHYWSGSEGDCENMF